MTPQATKWRINLLDRRTKKINKEANETERMEKQIRKGA